MLLKAKKRLLSKKRVCEVVHNGLFAGLRKLGHVLGRLKIVPAILGVAQFVFLSSNTPEKHEIAYI